jgi:hypothetical protein
MQLDPPWSLVTHLHSAAFDVAALDAAILKLIYLNDVMDCMSFQKHWDTFYVARNWYGLLMWLSEWSLEASWI